MGLSEFYQMRFTADPHHVPEARLLNTLSITELRGLAFYGSKVVHCAAVHMVKEENLQSSVIYRVLSLGY